MIDLRFVAKCGGCWNRGRAFRIQRRVTHSCPGDRAQSRAQRLKLEAGNCLSLAVTERSTAFAAELIDEAMKLWRRADELAPQR